eukprot:364403-Chlamydomonas_euryale.AAC.1
MAVHCSPPTAPDSLLPTHFSRPTAPHPRPPTHCSPPTSLDPLLHTHFSRPTAPHPLLSNHCSTPSAPHPVLPPVLLALRSLPCRSPSAQSPAARPAAHIIDQGRSEGHANGEPPSLPSPLALFTTSHTPRANGRVTFV